MSAVFEPVRAARLAWERSQPQLFLELDPCPDDPHGLTAVRHAGRGSTPNTNGRAGTTPKASASTAEKGTS